MLINTIVNKYDKLSRYSSILAVIARHLNLFKKLISLM